MASKIFPIILIGVVVWLGAMVWRDSGEGLRKAHEESAQTVRLVPPSARPPASDFTLPNAQGSMVKLAEYRGKSPVVLDFFATW